MNELTKYDELLARMENLRFYIKDIPSAGKALVFAKKLREFADLVEEKVKTRAYELMSDEEVKQIEADGFLISYIEPQETQEFAPRSVLEALGDDAAIPFLKVATGRLKSYLTKASMQGAVTMEEIMKCKEGAKTKYRKGYIKITEKNGVHNTSEKNK